MERRWRRKKSPRLNSTSLPLFSLGKLLSTEASWHLVRAPVERSPPSSQLPGKETAMGRKRLHCSKHPAVADSSPWPWCLPGAWCCWAITWLGVRQSAQLPPRQVTLLVHRALLTAFLWSYRNALFIFKWMGMVLC